MSGCPEKDLHSIYLDGEMPEKFAREYEAHLADCPACRAELEKMKKLSLLLREDASDIHLDNIYLDQSFERLQTKLKFSQTTERNHQKVYTFPFKMALSFATAAAVFAAIFAPVHLKTAPVQSMNVTAIARTEIKPVSENNVVVDGNIDQSKIASVLSTSSQKNEDDAALDNNYGHNQKVIAATSLASTSRRGPVKHYPDIDVFRPDFNNSPASVRIEVPDMHTIPLNQAGSFENN